MGKLKLNHVLSLSSKFFQCILQKTLKLWIFSFIIILIMFFISWNAILTWKWMRGWKSEIKKMWTEGNDVYILIPASNIMLLHLWLLFVGGEKRGKRGKDGNFQFFLLARLPFCRTLWLQGSKLECCHRHQSLQFCFE